MIKHFSLIFMLLCLSNCKDVKTTDPPQEDLGFFSLGEVKDYILFKPGSYWIYRNSYTNEIDTIVLQYCNLDTTYQESKLRKFSAEVITYMYKSKRDGAVYNSYVQVSNPEASNFFMVWSWRCTRIGGARTIYDNSNGDGCQFYYPFDSTNSRGNGVYSTTFSGRLGSLDVGGKIYTDVVAFSVLSDCSYPYPNKYLLSAGKSTYFWSKGNGLVRIVNDSWDAPNNGNQVHMVWDLLENKLN